MDERHREALRAFMAGELPDAIGRRLGIPIDEFTMGRLLEEVTQEMGYVPRPPFAPEEPITEPLPDSFTTRDGIEVILQRVPADQAINAWQSLVGEAPTSGRWPVVLSQRYPGSLQEHVIDLATDPHGPSTSSLIAKANRIDARRYLDEMRQENTKDPEALIYGALSERPPTRPMPPVQP